MQFSSTVPHQFEKPVLLTALLIKYKDNRQVRRDRELMSTK